MKKLDDPGERQGRIRRDQQRSIKGRFVRCAFTRQRRRHQQGGRIGVGRLGAILRSGDERQIVGAGPLQTANTADRQLGIADDLTADPLG